MRCCDSPIGYLHAKPERSGRSSSRSSHSSSHACQSILVISRTMLDLLSVYFSTEELFKISGQLNLDKELKHRVSNMMISAGKV
jgi:hypothetical protein